MMAVALPPFSQPTNSQLLVADRQWVYLSAREAMHAGSSWAGIVMAFLTAIQLSRRKSSILLVGWDMMGRTFPDTPEDLCSGCDRSGPVNDRGLAAVSAIDKQPVHAVDCQVT